MKINIKHVAQLARLELNSKELDMFEKQLSDILGYIDQLQEVDVCDTESTAQITGSENVLRQDEAEDWDETELEESLKQAPEIEKRQIKVRRVLK